jgi:hypothetical protein
MLLIFLHVIIEVQAVTGGQTKSVKKVHVKQKNREAGNTQKKKTESDAISHKEREKSRGRKDADTYCEKRENSEHKNLKKNGK